jgi:hypothetical protein
MGKAAALSVAVKQQPYTSDGAKAMLLTRFSRASTSQ